MKYVLAFIFCLSNLWSFSCSDPVILYEAPGWVWILDIASNQNKDVMISWVEESLNDNAETEMETIFFSKKLADSNWSDPKIIASDPDFYDYPKTFINSKGDLLANWKDYDRGLLMFVEEKDLKEKVLSLKESSIEKFEEVPVFLEEQIQLIGEGKLKGLSKLALISISKEKEVKNLLELEESERIVESTLEVFQEGEDLLLITQKKPCSSWSSSIPSGFDGKSLIYSWYKNRNWTSFKTIEEEVSEIFSRKVLFSGALNRQNSALVCWNQIENEEKDTAYKVQAVLVSQGESTLPIDLSQPNTKMIDTVVEIDDQENALVIMEEGKYQLSIAYKPSGQDWMFLDHPFNPAYEPQEPRVKSDHEGNFIVIFLGDIDGVAGVFGTVFSTKARTWSDFFRFSEKPFFNRDGMFSFPKEVEFSLTDSGKGVVCWTDFVFKEDSKSSIQNNVKYVLTKKSLKVVEFAY